MSDTRRTYGWCLVWRSSRKRVAWRLALICWALHLERLGNYFEDVRFTR